MIVLSLLIGLLTLLAAGFGAALLLMRGVRRINLLECLALGWLFGSGIISLLLWSGGLFLSGITLQMSVTVVAILLATWGVASARNARVGFSFPTPRNTFEWILGGAIALEIMAMIYIASGHGLGWDGLVNWEIKARYAFFNEGVIPAAYYHDETRAFTHPGYPLMIPLTELWLYLWMGEAHQFWIKIIFPLYYAAGAILLATTAKRLTNERWPGLVISALLFFVPFLTNSPGSATTGYADVPLSVLYLAAMGYLVVYVWRTETYALRIFAISLALLPWMKRDGAVLWLVGALCGSVVIWRSRRTLPPLLWLVPGAVVMTAWRVFLRAMATTNVPDFLPMTFGTLWENFSRLPSIGRMVLAEVMEMSHWSLFWPCIILTFVYLAFRVRDSRVVLLAIAVLAPVTLYATTYVFSMWPDYSVHFESSFSRLLLHVVPIACLALALALSRPTCQMHSLGDR